MLRAGEERSMAVRTAHVLTPTRRRRRAPPAVCLLALLAVGLTACNRPSQEPPAAGQPNRQARVVAVQTLAPRLRDLTVDSRSEEHTSELQSRPHLVCRLLLEKK